MEIENKNSIDIELHSTLDGFLIFFYEFVIFYHDLMNVWSISMIHWMDKEELVEKELPDIKVVQKYRIPNEIMGDRFIKLVNNL